MNRLLTKTTEFVFSKQRTIFSSALILALMIVVSRVFGFFRYRILAGYFTATDLDIFFASFRIPDLIFEILITGAFTSAFIPIFMKYQENSEELTENVSSIINTIMIFLFIGILLLFLFMDKIIFLITPGYSAAKNEAIIFYSRLLLVGQLPFLVLGNILTGIGQANKTFLLTAVAPVIYNVAIILVTVVLFPNLHLMAPIAGVIFGGVLFFVVQLPLLTKTHFTYSLILKKTKGLVEFVRVTVPRLVTVLVAQIDATVDLTLTTFLGAGSYTVFYFAQHLQLLPVSVLGIAYGQASLPYLSEIYQSGRIEEFKKIIIDSILNLFFVTVPVAAFLVFARTPVVRLFFGGARFDWAATVDTAVAVSYFALSLPLHTVYYFLTRCFYSFMDSKTPFYISVVSVGINTLFSIVFIMILKLPVWSLALAFSLSMSLNVLLLFIFLDYRVKNFDIKFLTIEILKMGIAAGASSIPVYFFMKILDYLVLDTSRTINIFILLTIGSLVFFALYILLAWLLDIKEIYLLSKLILKAKEYKKKIFEIYTVYE